MTNINPSNINWNRMWMESLKKIPKRPSESRYWDDVAHKFNQWTEKEDYRKKLIYNIDFDENSTILDIGCGSGAITIPLAKKVKQVTAIDVSSEMLKVLKKSATDEDLDNIVYVNSRWEDVDVQMDLEKHDVVIASRSLGGIFNLKEELLKINHIARKRVYLTALGANDRKFEKNVHQLLGREFHNYPDYIYLYNILYQIGIYANIRMLECDNRTIFRDIDDAMDRCLSKGKLKGIKKDELLVLRRYLRDNLIENKEGMLEYPAKKADWALIWWKK